MHGKTLPSELAGLWYPADAASLRRELDHLGTSRSEAVTENLLALLLPHAGYAYSGSVAMQGLAHLPQGRYKRIMVIGPSHYVPISNRVSLPEVDSIATPLGSVPLDREACACLRNLPMVTTLPAAHTREHSVQIQLPLLQHRLGATFALVPLVTGPLTPDVARAFADGLRPILDADTLVLASSDLTHYGERFGYRPFRDHVFEKIEALDRRILETIQKRDARAFRHLLAETGATVCGQAPIEVLLHLLPASVNAEQIAYDTSGRQTGDPSHSVSYAAMAFFGAWNEQPLVPETTPEGSAGREPPLLSGPDRKALIELARFSLEQAVRNGRTPERAGHAWRLTPGCERVMGGFVTLQRPDGSLRGCIGEVMPQRAIGRVVLEQAAHAALNDPRFPPVSPAETPELRIEISALTPPHRIASVNEIEIGRHGILLEKQRHSAVFLPQVAVAQGWTRDQTLSHLARKAGLPENGWQGATFQVFEAEVFGEA